MTPEEVVTQAGIEGLTVANLGDWDGLKAAVAKGMTRRCQAIAEQAKLSQARTRRRGLQRSTLDG